jgi:lysophospholipase L1-like esterase
MKIFFSIIFLSIFMFSCSMQNKIHINFFGDSITEAAVKPGGYIVRLNEMLEKNNLKDKYLLTGAGIGGNKVYDLYLRLDDDVLSKRPDVVMIYIGVNDVWHKQSTHTGTDADKFEKFYLAILKKLSDKKIKAVLCTPAVIGEKTDASNELDKELDLYSNIIRDIATKNKLPIVDLRKAFLAYNLQNNKSNKEAGILTTDRVHLNDKGNQFVAEKIWEVLKTIK